MPARLIPIAAEGWPFVLVPLAVALALGWAGWMKTALACGLLAVAMALFFRDPERTVPSTAGAVVAPADGKVTDVRTGLYDPFVGPAQLVSIFLSPLDVHINRAPLAGLVADVQYQPGLKLAAYRPDASERNERTIIAIQGESARVVVRQVAGVLARRIVCRVQAGDKLGAGERFGLIKFGSRTDVVMPAAARLAVRVGDRVRGGETIVGVLP